MLSSGSGSGLIKAENGLSVSFDSSAVLAYDAASLAIGQLVTFDLERGHCPRAINVCVRHPSSHPEEKRPESIHIRYMGFEQTEGIRTYRFEGALPGEETKTFVVTTELALFKKHRVGIQEGPALCLHLLLAELDGARAAGWPPSQRGLTDQHILAYAASRPARGAKSHPKRMPHASAAASHGA